MPRLFGALQHQLHVFNSARELVRRARVRIEIMGLVRRMDRCMIPSMQAGDRPYAVIVVLGTLNVVLLIIVAFLLMRGAASPLGGVGLSDEQRSAAEIAAMVAAITTPGVWDSHPDADVARVMQPGIQERLVRDRTVSSNLQGMREDTVILPKPEGTVRVVLLGDSYIYGLGVEAHERMGVHLQRFLDERKQAKVERIEVLHFGVSSWNLISECAFLRRQMTLLRPDLVVHLSVRNDLADTMGARGFGSISNHSPRLPARAGGAIKTGFARLTLDSRAHSMLPLGLDHESRTRFKNAADAVALLARRVAESGGEYLHVFHWVGVNSVAAQRIAPRLSDGQVLYLPQNFHQNPDWILTSNDHHWNPAGHEQVARLFYGVIDRRGLLPNLNLSPWPEVSEWAGSMARTGFLQALDPAALPKPGGTQVVDMRQLTRESASQVHTGVTRDGMLSPYASILLRSRNARQLVVKGICLDRPELDGGTVVVALDGVKVGTIELAAGKKVDLTMRIPEQVQGRTVLTVRFVSDDFVYVGDDLRSCVSFQLQRVELIK